MISWAATIATYLSQPLEESMYLTGTLNIYAKKFVESMLDSDETISEKTEIKILSTIFPLRCLRA